MKGRLHVQFNGEEGIDAGGVTREWYVILARQIFDPNYALFCRSAAKAATYQPNKASAINREHLDNFRFVGRIFGKAIYDGQLLDAYFTRAFYKHILGIKPTYHDIEAEDPEYYKSLCWILENDITDIIDETFSTEFEEFGQQHIVDLKPNGRNVQVTEENKEEYVRLVTEVKLTKAISMQIASFKEGFHELIPLEDCRIFNEVELELLTSGLPDIDVADLKANVEYTGYTPGSPQINWFWTAVSRMGQEDLARLVMFVTGTSKVPLEGFSALQGMNGLQKFQIHRASGGKDRLPSAHTCFNQLDLPEYDSCDTLSERLLRAVRETEGFGFA
jgi:E3 ubiquitin-protein ligase HUWE1